MLFSSLKKNIKNILHLLLRNKDGYNVIRILSGPARGVSMKLDLRDGGSYLTGQYDKWIFDRIRLDQLVKPGMVAWDCGAFYGYYAAIFRRLVGELGCVEVFEASKMNFDIVSSLPQLNKWDNMHVHKLAIGPDHTTIQFTTNLGGSSGPFGLAKDYGDATDHIQLEEVTSCGVDELVFERNIRIPDIIKFDLESAEVYALHNGDKIFREKRPLVFLELHGDKAMTAAGEFSEKYNYYGYSVWQLNRPDRIKITSQSDYKLFEKIPHMIFLFPAELEDKIHQVFRAD